MYDFNVNAYSSDEEARRPKVIRYRPNHLEEWDWHDFFARFRLQPRTVENILEEVQDIISYSTNRNDCLSLENQLLLGLRYYATGSFLSVAGDFCGKICKQNFFNIARFPRVIGTIDCSHIRIQSPGGDNAELFRNRKQFFFLNVQTIADANLRIQDIVVRWPGSSHDAHIRQLDNSDLIACTVLWKDGTKMRRFLVIDILQLILVEPDTKRLGWGVAKLVGFLQDIEVTGDKDDSRCLHITIHRPISGATTNRVPLLNAKFIFDDNIRCMAAKQRLTKGRIKARQKKMQHIARLLEIPGQSGPPSPAFAGQGLYGSRPTGRGIRENRPLFNISRGPGFAAPRRESSPGVIHRTDESRRHREGESPNRISNLKKENGRKENRSRDNSTSRVRSREGSPRMPRPRSEEIPLELIKKAPNSVIDMAPKIVILPRPQTPRTVIEPVASTSSENSTAKDVNTSIVSTVSEETSFIAEELNKGDVETV